MSVCSRVCRCLEGFLSAILGGRNQQVHIDGLREVMVPQHGENAEARLTDEVTPDTIPALELEDLDLIAEAMETPKDGQVRQESNGSSTTPGSDGTTPGSEGVERLNVLDAFEAFGAEVWAPQEPQEHMMDMQSEDGDMDLDMDMEMNMEEDCSKPLTASSIVPGSMLDGYVLGASIGSGGQACIFKAHSRDGSAFALKVATSPTGVSSMQREIRVLKQLQPGHENVLPLVESVGNGRALVLPLCTGGDLQQFALRYGKKRALRIELDMQEMFCQLLEGIRYLHSLNVAHRDVKLPNILLEAEGSTQVRLCDFGAAVYSVHAQQAIKDVPGTFGYMSSEALAAQTKAGSYEVKSADLWACGIVWWGLTQGAQLPFGNFDPALKLGPGEYILPWDNFQFRLNKEETKKLLKPLLNQKPEDRNVSRAIDSAANVHRQLLALE